MPTAYELYSRPDPLEDEPEPHSWDGEIIRLAALDEMEYLIQRWIESYGSELEYFEMGYEERDAIIEAVREHGHKKGVRLFLEERGHIIVSKPRMCSSKELEEMNDNDLSALMRGWTKERRDASTPFRVRLTDRMIDRIKREYERRGYRYEGFVRRK